jgi:predicted secreted protein
VAAGLLAGVLCCGVGLRAAEKEAPVTGTGILVTQNDSEKTVTLAGKEHLVVALGVNAGTGYHWELKRPCRELRLDRQYVIRPLNAAPVGGPRLATFNFGPRRSGTCRLEFDLHAPGGKVERTVQFTVTVGKTE